ncbi:hypothetical protein B4U79_07159 [Dinothrombium tinctorium]|uniref:Uncharacterized protein n=1 Tax=Dinothrombium tinctorium TaxID=1965070 RepID=A0A443RI58_9ACAR|nr:hypothetical protein B4U79_02781 [Dinothrombium tinctorium]RWS14923.1 hypothetical protein B4U79_03081 [Dinothrombium tinctorium]RWS17349.1 hypothetical protein B4U79_07159 [Dinothrombium tinctorium]
MDILPSVNIFNELQVVHDTGYLSAQLSLEDKWQQPGSSGRGAPMSANVRRSRSSPGSVLRVVAMLFALVAYPKLGLLGERDKGHRSHPSAPDHRSLRFVVAKLKRGFAAMDIALQACNGEQAILSINGSSYESSDTLGFDRRRDERLINDIAIAASIGTSKTSVLTANRCIHNQPQ